MDFVKEIKNFVESECNKPTSKYGSEPFEFHFVSVVNYADKLSDEDKKIIDDAVEEAKKVSEDSDASEEAVKDALKALNDKIMPIGAKMYEKSSDDDKKEDDKEKKDEPVEGEVVDEKDDKKDK